MVNESKHGDESAAMSYKLLRNIIGFLGMGLPVIIVVGAYLIDGDGFLDSISAYYHTSMGDVLVGILFITAAFMFTYNPEDYPDGYIDNIGGFIAGICAIGVAVFPADVGKASCDIVVNGPSIEFIGLTIEINTLHTIFAVGFFMILTIFSLFLFTKSREKPGVGWTSKKIRNIVYIACGIIMAAALVVIPIYYFLRCHYPDLQALNLVFWLESVALLAFGFSWLTKGEFFFPDKK